MLQQITTMTISDSLHKNDRTLKIYRIFREGVSRAGLAGAT